MRPDRLVPLSWPFSPAVVRMWCLAVVFGGLAGCRQTHIFDTATDGLPSQLAAGKTEVAELSPKQIADLQIAMARTLQRQDELTAAMKAYQTAIEHDPTRSDAHRRLAILHDRRGEFDKSAALYKQALNHDPKDPDVYCDFGYSLYVQDRIDEAEANFRQALALEPDHQRAHNNLGMLLARTGKIEEALAHCRKGGCDDAEAHVNVAVALMLDGELETAREHFVRAEGVATNDRSAQAARDGLNDLETTLARLQNGEAAKATEVSQASAEGEAGVVDLVSAERETAPSSSGRASENAGAPSAMAEQ